MVLQFPFELLAEWKKWTSSPGCMLIGKANLPAFHHDCHQAHRNDKEHAAEMKKPQLSTERSRPSTSSPEKEQKCKGDTEAGLCMLHSSPEGS